MRLLIITSIVGLAILLLLAGHVWAEPNHYNEITTMLQLPQVPYPDPANVSEAEANVCYINQNIRAILEANQAVIDRIKRVIKNEKQMARGK